MVKTRVIATDEVRGWLGGDAGVAAAGVSFDGPGSRRWTNGPAESVCARGNQLGRVLTMSTGCGGDSRGWLEERIAFTPLLTLTGLLFGGIVGPAPVVAAKYGWWRRVGGCVGDVVLREANGLPVVLLLFFLLVMGGRRACWGWYCVGVIFHKAAGLAGLLRLLLRIAWRWSWWRGVIACLAAVGRRRTWRRSVIGGVVLVGRAMVPEGVV